MPSDIFAFIQAQPQAQTAIQTSIPTQTDSTETLPGLFDSLITQYISTEQEEIIAEEVTLPAIIEPEIPSQPVTFNSSNSYSRTIIDMLAADTEPVMPEPESPEDDEEIIWFENTPDTAEHERKVSILPLPETEQPEPEHDIVMPDNVPDREKAIQPEVSPKASDVVSRVKFFLSENPEADIDEVISFMLSDDDIAETLPENFSAKDIKLTYDDNDLPEDSNNVETKGEKIVRAVTEYLTAPKEAKLIQPKASAITDDDDDTDDKEDTATITIDTDTSTAGLAIATQTIPEAPEAATTPDVQEHDTTRNIPVNTRDTLPAQPQQVRTSRRDNTPAPDTQPEHESPNTPETLTFRATLDARTAQHEETGQDTPEHEEHDADSREHGQDFGQNDRDTQGNTSRSRTDTRRTDRQARTETLRTQSEHTSTATTTVHRTNSFQSFFQGVMNNRRTSQASTAPMNLRETYSFTQAQTLRNGLVNVVRFIRTDGVQKARVIVDPPALGRISVELTSGTSGVEASIKVSNEQIRQLVQDQLSQLRMNLSRQGVQVAEFTVDVQQDNSHNQNSQDQGREQRRVNVISGTEEDEPEEFRVDLEEGLLYWLA